MKLTEWVPTIAAEYKVPAPLIHMKAQQIARAEGIQWGMEMSKKDTNTIIAGVRQEITHAIKSTRK